MSLKLKFFHLSHILIKQWQRHLSGHIYEVQLDIREAILREKRIKKWNRQWKINLIEQNNPHWINLSIGLC